ncbi:MAG: hypothetical protein O9340_08805 [Cyclobacteriaceae bacterium]|jgi:hypothetical protein|nr:hypothetical protein [Cyclobacteriaceae bacterium]
MEAQKKYVLFFLLISFCVACDENKVNIDGVLEQKIEVNIGAGSALEAFESQFFTYDLTLSENSTLNYFIGKIEKYNVDKVTLTISNLSQTASIKSLRIAFGKYQTLISDTEPIAVMPITFAGNTTSEIEIPLSEDLKNKIENFLLEQDGLNCFLSVSINSLANPESNFDFEVTTKIYISALIK